MRAIEDVFRKYGDINDVYIPHVSGGTSSAIWVPILLQMCIFAGVFWLCKWAIYGEKGFVKPHRNLSPQTEGPKSADRAVDYLYSDKYR